MQKLFRKSLELSRALFPINIEERNGRRCVHFSILWDKNRLLVIGENKINTNPRNRFNLRDFDIGMKGTCSELNAFIQAKNKYSDINWKKVTMVNIRIDLNGNIRNSCPCNACKNLITYISPKNIFFSNDNGEFQEYK